MGALIVLILIAWSPWITKSYAESRVVKVFEEDQKDFDDGCGFNCDGCGVKESQKRLFGYSVKIEYGCGFVSPGYPEHHQIATKFVSFIGTVH